jgi:hypothetical protein
VDTPVGNLNCPASCKYFNAENTENRGVINKAATGLRDTNLCNMQINLLLSTCERYPTNADKQTTWSSL